MDSQHFDRLTQQFGTVLNRRRLGAVLAALGLSTSLGVKAKARNKNKKKKKKKACDRKQKQKCRKQDRVCEDGACVVSCNARNSVCRGNPVIQACGGPQEECSCSPLAGGGFVCAENFEECPEFSECIGALDCAPGEVCVDVSGEGCCGEARIGLCLKRCSGRTPGF